MTPEDRETIEKMITHAILPVAGELRMIDPTELITLLHGHGHEQIRDLVDSATEQYFVPDFLNYRESGDSDVSWIRPPTIRFDMVLNAPSISFEFALKLTSHSVVTQLNGVHRQEWCDASQSEIEFLRRSIEINKVVKQCS